VTTRKPNPAPQSEEELLEQWAFLDRLVESQAARLRAGLQDAEEADEPSAGVAELQSLRREVERLRADVARAQAARAAAEVEARRSRDALIALGAARERPAPRGAERHAPAEGEAAGWRERAEAAERELAGLDLRARRENAELRHRLAEAAAERQRAEQAAASALEALDQARLEIENLRAQAPGQHGFWRVGRR
jgi:hypothetical protein